MPSPVKTNDNNNESSKSKIFCIVKTHPSNINSGKTLNVLNVWVKKCNNYRYFLPIFLYLYFYVIILFKKFLKSNFNFFYLLFIC